MTIRRGCMDGTRSETLRSTSAKEYKPVASVELNWRAIAKSATSGATGELSLLESFPRCRPKTPVPTFLNLYFPYLQQHPKTSTPPPPVPWSTHTMKSHHHNPALTLSGTERKLTMKSRSNCPKMELALFRNLQIDKTRMPGTA